MATLLNDCEFRIFDMLLITLMFLLREDDILPRMYDESWAGDFWEKGGGVISLDLGLELVTASLRKNGCCLAKRELKNFCLDVEKDKECIPRFH